MNPKKLLPRKIQHVEPIFNIKIHTLSKTDFVKEMKLQTRLSIYSYARNLYSTSTTYKISVALLFSTIKSY